MQHATCGVAHSCTGVRALGAEAVPGAEPTSGGAVYQPSRGPPEAATPLSCELGPEPPSFAHWPKADEMVTGGDGEEFGAAIGGWNALDERSGGGQQAQALAGQLAPDPDAALLPPPHQVKKSIVLNQREVLLDAFELCNGPRCFGGSPPGAFG